MPQAKQHLVDQMLADHVAVITGAVGGLGSTLVECFAGYGASVAVLDLDKQKCAEVADRLQASGTQAMALPCDIVDEEEVARAVRQVAERFGRCDILVNNAAVAGWVSLADVDLAEWNRVISINLTGSFLCIQHFGELMRRNHYGSIVNVGSAAGGTVPEFEAGSYSSSKAGLEILARQVAIEWGPQGIRANTVCPGMMEAPMGAALWNDPEIRRARESMVASNRIGSTREIAEVVAFLASPRASFVNGQSIDVDGGMTQMLTKLLPRPASSPGH